MKKLFLTLSLALIFNALSALPTFICTSQGYLFYTYWYYDSQGNLAYTLESQGPGSCSGGPWTMFAVPISSGFDDNATFASSADHDKFSTFSIPVETNAGAEVLKEAMYLTSVDSKTLMSFDPNRIHPLWAKSFALSNNLSVYALALRDHPFTNSMKFDIWSVKGQTVKVSLINPLTGLAVWSDDIALNEGKNPKTDIHFGNDLSGNYILRVSSDKNIINKSVLINN